MDEAVLVRVVPRQPDVAVRGRADPILTERTDHRGAARPDCSTAYRGHGLSAPRYRAVVQGCRWYDQRPLATSSGNREHQASVRFGRPVAGGMPHGPACPLPPAADVGWPAVGLGHVRAWSRLAWAWAAGVGDRLVEVAHRGAGLAHRCPGSEAGWSARSCGPGAWRGADPPGRSPDGPSPRARSRGRPCARPAGRAGQARSPPPSTRTRSAFPGEWKVPITSCPASINWERAGCRSHHWPPRRTLASCAPPGIGSRAGWFLVTSVVSCRSSL
jgi:hypothetical protein